MTTVTGARLYEVRGCVLAGVTFRWFGGPLMIKPFALAALILGVAPLVAFADPMSVGGDANLLAATNVASAAAAGGSGASMADPTDAADDDTVREPLTTPEPPAPHHARQQPDAAHPPGAAPAHAGHAAHKKAETTRWQSLLPGVMK